MVRWLVAVLAAVALLFGVAFALSATAGRAPSGFGEPVSSHLRLVESVLRPSTLSPADLRRGRSTCLEGTSLVLNPGSGCKVIIPDGVQRVALRRVAGAGPMLITMSAGGGVTQVLSTGDPSPDLLEPDRLRLAVPHNGTTMTLSDCTGPARCRVDLES